MIDLKPYRHYSDILVETGTAHGDGVQRALNAGFEKVISIELDEKLFKKAYGRFYKNEKVRILYGKSFEVLPTILKGLSKPAVFFLDAHPAGEGTAGHEGWLKRDVEVFQDTIIKKELAVILAHRNDHVILIDDQHGPDEWNQVYIEFARQVNPGYKAQFHDQTLGNTHHKEKILSLVP